MHYLLGLAALVMGAVIATRRTRPTWFVVLTSVLVAVGALLAILSYTRVTDGLGLVPNSVIGWIFVGLSIMTMLSSIFVLERRGAHGEELPPLIGDNPFDGDADDSDDPRPGAAHGAAGSTADAHGNTPRSAAEDAAVASVTGATASVGAAGAAPAGAPGYASVGASGTEAYAEETVMHPALPDDTVSDDTVSDDTASSHPGPSPDAHDGSETTGDDPDIATEPLESDTAHEHGTDDQGTHR